LHQVGVFIYCYMTHGTMTLKFINVRLQNPSQGQKKHHNGAHIANSSRLRKYLMWLPAGAFSGISCIEIVWWSLYTDSPYSVSRVLPSSSC